MKESVIVSVNFLIRYAKLTGYPGSCYRKLSSWCLVDRAS